MFENDICLCASKDCPRYEECIRGGAVKREGIYTIALLRESCNQNNKYIMFIGADKKND